MSIPGWYTLTLLSLAAFRTWRLLAEDDILDRPRRYITKLGKKWEKDGDVLPIDYRMGLAQFISCSWCLGFYVGLAWWGTWQTWPHGTSVAAVVFAISALIPLAERVTSSP